MCMLGNSGMQAEVFKAARLGMLSFSQQLYWLPRFEVRDSCISLHLRLVTRKEDEDTNATVTKAEFNRLLAAMEGVQDQIQTMKRELWTEREAANESLTKRIRLDRGLVFKKKQYEKQYCFNEEVRGKISSATNSLDSAPPAVERAKEALKEGERLLVARQKAIRIADWSEFGWATVDEYEEDELAENSDDEKRLYWAEMRAGR